MNREHAAAEPFVFTAMGLVCLTFAVVLYQHGGLPGSVAAPAAIAAFVVLLSIHMVVWRRIDPKRLLRAARLPRAATPASTSALDTIAQLQVATAKQAQPGPPQTWASAPRAPDVKATPAPPPPVASPPKPQPAARPAQQPAAQGRTSAVDAAYMQELVSHLSTSSDDDDAEPPYTAPKALTADARSREADVEVIQDAIKRLLAEVNASERKDAPVSAARARADVDAAISQSVDALRTTADAVMRKPDEAPRQALQPAAVPQATSRQQRSPVHPSEARARVMSDAISAGRIDVALEPILGLEDQKTRHYEVSVRLRDADGQALDVFGEGPDLRGTGLLPLFDSVSIVRVAAVARRLDERGKGGSVFSAFNGESIADERFVGELAETLHQRASLATQLVLSFSQSDVRDFSTPEWDSLADMRALGFRFAISNLTDMDMDFETLAEQGFSFAKLEAQTFLSGLRDPSGLIPARDVCRHLAKAGLTLVVERIENDDQLARIFGFGVLLGQGQLFGGARPVRADAIRATPAA